MAFFIRIKNICGCQKYIFFQKSDLLYFFQNSILIQGYKNVFSKINFILFL